MKPTTHQRGSVVVYTAVTLMAVLTASVIAIEMGRIYQARQHYQKMASLAALDATRMISGCDSMLIPTQAAIEARVQESLVRNGDPAEITERVVETGRIVIDAPTATRYLEPSGIADARAVRVTLTGRFPRTLTGLLPQSENMRVSATAEQGVVGTFQVGSGLVDVSSRNTVLSALLGNNVSLSLVDYQRLAGANITLEQLGTAVGLDVQDLSDPLALAAQTPVLSDVIGGLAQQLSAAGDQATADVLTTLAQAAAGGGNPAVPLDLIIGATDGTAAQAPLVNALELLTALAQAAQADDGGTTTPLALSVTAVPLVGTVRTYLNVIEPARIGTGRPGSDDAVATTAQVRLKVRIEASTVLTGLQAAITSLVNNLITGLLSVLGGVINVSTTVTVVPPPLNIGVDVEAAKATAYLDRVQCPRAGVNNGDPIAELSAATGTATVDIGTYSGTATATHAPALSPTSSIPLANVAINATCAVRLLGVCIANLGSTNLALSLQATAVGVGQTGPSDLPLDVTQFTYEESLSDGRAGYAADGVPPAAAVTGNPQTVGSSTSVALTLGLASTQTGSGLTGLLGGLVASVVSGVQGLVQGLLNFVNGLVASTIDPLLQALGVRTGTATVTMQSVTVDQPVIVSVCLPDSNFLPPRGCPGG